MKQATLRDFIQPEFRDKDPDDYEVRDDGAIVRKDRWEMGVRRIRSAIGDNRCEFEIDDAVSAVQALVSLVEHLLPPPEEDMDEEDTE